MVKYKVSDHAEWTKRTSGIQPAIVKDVLFSDIFKKYLPYNSNMTCLEIGAIPGRFLVFFHREFGYKIEGLDFADNTEAFTRTMVANKIKDYKFIKKDIFKYSPTRKYDVVASFGFIEHFDDTERVIKKHCSLVKSGGYLIITLPNFRYLQYAYHRLLDRENLDIHNTSIMSLNKICKLVQAEGFMTLYSGYAEDAEFWREPVQLRKHQEVIEKMFLKLAIKLKKFPKSRIYSPYLVTIFKNTV